LINLLDAGVVHTTLQGVLGDFHGLRQRAPIPRAVRMRRVYIGRAVAVLIGNRYGHQEMDCDVSARELEGEFQRFGLRTHLWINEPGGLPMLQRLRALITAEVRADDNGFVFVFCGHGEATKLLGNDGVKTSFQDIVDAIDGSVHLRGKPKVLINDCCQVTSVRNAAGAVEELPREQLDMPADTVFVRSTGFGAEAKEQPVRGGVYSKWLAETIREYGRSSTVEDLLKRAQAQVRAEIDRASSLGYLPTGVRQLAHFDISLGGYHLYLGDSRF
jgi:hypothetical protein